MKKVILFLFLLAGTYSVCHAQFYTGINASYYKGELFSDADTEGIYAGFPLKVNVRGGYAFNGRWSAGLELGYHHAKENIKLEGGVRTHTPKTNLWMIAPFVRYTIASKGDFSFLVDAKFSYHTSKTHFYSDDESSYIPYDFTYRNNMYGFLISPVLSYDLSRHFSIEASMSLLSLAYINTKREGVMWGQDATSTHSDFNVALAGTGKALDDVSLALIYKF